MNTLFALSLGFLSAFVPHTSEFNKDGPQNYNCSALQWITPAAMQRDGHLRGQAQVICDFAGKAGGGFPALETYLTEQLKQQATHVYSGPVAGSFSGLPANTYDLDLGLQLSDSKVEARENAMIATDKQSRLVSVMKTSSVTGSSYDDYIKGFAIIMDVASVSANSNYHGTLSVSIDMTKPWYAPSGVFQSEVVKTVEGAVVSYRDTLINELQNHL